MSADGEEVAWDTVRLKLQEIIDHEDKQHAASATTSWLRELAKHGLTVARRTVTKYRKAMNIPSSRQRRDWTLGPAAGRKRPARRRRKVAGQRRIAAGFSADSAFLDVLDVQAATLSLRAACAVNHVGYLFNVVDAWEAQLRCCLVAGGHTQRAHSEHAFDDALFESHVVDVDDFDAVGDSPQDPVLVKETLVGEAVTVAEAAVH